MAFAAGAPTNTNSSNAGSSSVVTKYLSLLILVLQNTLLVVLMGYSRRRSVSSSSHSQPLYAASTAVLCTEVVKFIACLSILLWDRKGSLNNNGGRADYSSSSNNNSNNSSNNGRQLSLIEDVFGKPNELARLAVPSIMYAIQNNLLYYALSNLDAASFQVSYQLKILTTALFSVLMLGKSLSNKQWLSLTILCIGVAIAQLYSVQLRSNSNHHNTLLGFAAVFGAACSSGFSGVYFERIVKTTNTDLWVRNMQMGVSGIVSATVAIYLSGELPGVYKNGFFSGYDPLVVSVILLQAVGGLVVAVVVKYADNILKGFAASFSLLTSCLFQYLVFEFHPTWGFAFGALLVNISMVMYADHNSSGVNPAGGANRETEKQLERV